MDDLFRVLPVGGVGVLSRVCRVICFFGLDISAAWVIFTSCLSGVVSLFAPDFLVFNVGVSGGLGFRSGCPVRAGVFCCFVCHGLLRVSLAGFAPSFESVSDVFVGRLAGWGCWALRWLGCWLVVGDG